MSGHSKWSTIKRKKGALDAKKGAEFTKLGRLIEVAAKSGADPSMNFRLKLAVQKAKAANMPAANVEKAIRKGAGLDKDKSSIEEVMYEGLGPGGIAVMVHSLTDNRNRTVSDLRNLFTKTGGSLGNSGSVAWQFANRGILTAAKTDPDLELKAIEAGAEDIQDQGDVWEIYTKPTELNQVKQNLVANGVNIQEDKLALVPTTLVKITDANLASKIIQFMEALEDNEDVAEVFSNFDIDDAILKELG
jgi:YebC/PmpR family DNA-binding regulatory protein